MKPAIEIKNLGKEYKLHSSTPYLALREALTDIFKNIFQPAKKTNDKFWALQNINLAIMPGERVGIIGRNGAGKSTLLKIISRITAPTTGEAIIRGRVGSLLEVGTGFHPELTGRENIYLNGSILGLKKAEINQQLDAIIDFSGVEKFIDTPLKHYSSGMQLRLAFSVAAHLEPEILLIDEVLAVGDIEFQKKCIGKMEEVSQQQGRTILFVSHNMAAIQSLCEKVIYLSEGRIIEYGTTNTTIATYLKNSNVKIENKLPIENNFISVVKSEVRQENIAVTEAMLGYPLSIELAFFAKTELNNLEIAYNIKNSYGEIITHLTTLDQQVNLKASKGETKVISAELHSLNPSPGQYSIDLFILTKGELVLSSLEHMVLTVINSDKALRPDGFPSHVKSYTPTKWQIQDNENL